MHRVDDGLERAAVVHLLQALGSRSAASTSAVASPDHSASNTWRAPLFDTVPSATRRISAASVAGVDRASRRCRALGVEPLAHLAHQPVGSQLGLPQASRRAS
jgi:hypothetical protein